MRKILTLIGCLLAFGAAVAMARPADEDKLPSAYMPTGKQMFKQYCASCHGEDARGEGPLAAFLKVPPSDLTALAKKHDGRFPREYVTSVLQLGTTNGLHGTSDMPVWGPIFQYYDKDNERAVQQRIKNLCDYIASLQRN